MAGFSLELPTIQNWSCHSCSGCCRQHGIAITEAEHERIVQQNWTTADGVPAGQPLFVRMGLWPGKRWWRLAHQPDGRCVFLDDAGLCRIHAKFGERAKPLACRIYPYAFHPKGRQVVVGLRFSCPSVVRNRGRSLSSQQKELRELARQVVPDNVTQARPPRLSSRTRLEWNDLLRVVHELDATLSESKGPLPVRMLRALHWIALLETADLKAISGARLSELLQLLSAASACEFAAGLDLSTVPPPGRLARMLFRLLAGHYARVDSYTAGHGTLRGRAKLLGAALRLARGRGALPALDPRLQRVDFETLEAPFGPLPSEAADILTRYFRVKLESMHFCGRAFYGVPLVEGFRSLALVLPVTQWIARWFAASAGRSVLTTEDVADALALADHHHGYSPMLGTFNARGRVGVLERLGEIPRLIAWYSR